MAPHRQPGFRGRASECQLLDGLLETVREGQSAALVIRGEAGVGKTALLRYAAGQASGLRTVQLAGVEAEMELPFAGLHQLCGSMVDHLPALPAPQQGALRVAFGLAFGDAPDPFLVGLGTLSLLSEAGAERPLVCFVDDAQWLDAATRHVLGFVARRLLAESVGLIFAVREPRDERRPTDERELVRLPELLLTGLKEDEAGALLAAVIPGRLDRLVRDRIIGETGGNPLALLELSRGITTAQLAGGFGLPTAADLPAQIEDHYLGRIRALPEPTQHLMLLAAADPVGDAALLWRAAQSLGIERWAAEPAEADQLLEIGAGVRFRHPLVRSAVYHAASTADRRAAHRALASATDPEVDPDRRAWHRAHAANGPDEEVAAELLRRANDAERRGGVAAAAAFMEWAAMLTPDLGARALRALAAAGAKFQAGDFATAESLLATADAGLLDELGRAQVERMRAQIAFDLRRGSDAPGLLLHAARRLERLDAELARETYLEGLVAGIYAARLANDTKAADLAIAARSAPLGPEPLPARQQLLLGLAIRLTEGYAAAVPTLTNALGSYRAEGPQLDWLSVAYNLAAMDLWDDNAWFELASSQADMARSTGRLVLLPYALDYLAGFYILTGEFSRASGLVTEAEGLALGARAETLPYISLRLAAWRGQNAVALDLAEVMMRGALSRGEGCAITVTEYAIAVLYNGLGQYQLALEAAQKAAAADEVVTSSWALYELVEAASRCGREAMARDAAERLCERASPRRDRVGEGDRGPLLGARGAR